MVVDEVALFELQMRAGEYASPLFNVLEYLALFGIVPGVLAAYAAARGMSALLFGIPPGDPATFATAVAVTLLIVFAGTLVPAWRAVRLTPMSALRAE